MIFSLKDVSTSLSALESKAVASTLILSEVVLAFGEFELSTDDNNSSTLMKVGFFELVFGIKTFAELCLIFEVK